jgi:lipid-binding SYLF domain-containing protein
MKRKATTGGRRAALPRSDLRLAAAILLVAPLAGLAAQGEEVRRVEEATMVFEEITAIPDKTVPDHLLREARAVVIVPGLLKAGFVVGGEFGRGVLLERLEDGGWSNPVFVTLSGGGIGFQAGIRSTDLLLVFRTDRGVNGVLRGDLTLGVDLAAAAGPVGRQARASTDMELKAEIYSYSRSRGFFAGLSLDGSVLSVDDEANAAFYKNDELGPREILRNPALKAPGAAAELRRTLQDYLHRLPPREKTTP